MNMASGGRDQTIPRSGKFLIGIQEGHGLGMRDNIIGSQWESNQDFAFGCLRPD